MQFGIQFYRTPEKTARRMYDGLVVDEYTKILDTGAGDGALLEMARILAREKKARALEKRYDGQAPEWFLENWERDRKKHEYLCAIEIDPDLQAVLKRKKFKVIDSDFLASGAVGYYFDYIMMNPEFRNGATHLLHAWDLNRAKVIKCLLNAETINNPYSQDRQRLLTLISQHGKVEHLGKVFIGADRKTSVDVVLVTLTNKREREKFNFSFDPETEDVDGSGLEDFSDMSLVSADVFVAYEASYKAALEAYKVHVYARSKLHYYMGQVLDDRGKAKSMVGGAEADYEKFVIEFTESCWKAVFEKTKLASLMTEAVQKELSEMQEGQKMMAFTAKNMKELLLTLFSSKDKIMTDCVLNAFDHMTKGHYKNADLVQGWKTNSDYMVGKRFILGNIGSWDGISHYSYEKLRDIEKALCFLTGKNFEEITSIVEVYRDRSTWSGIKVQTTFFELKLYGGVGSMHFRWLDEDLRQRFNQMVGQVRFGFIPPKTKQGAYK